MSELREWELEVYSPLSDKEWKYITSLMNTYKGKPYQQFRVLQMLRTYSEANRKKTYFKFLRFLSGCDDIPDKHNIKKKINES